LTKTPRAVEKAIFERDKETCQICGRTTEFGDGEIDHKIPRSKGGSDDPENLQWACHRCNKLKGNKRTNEEVRRLLSLPEIFEDIMKHRMERKPTELSPPRNQKRLPVLSREGLDQPSVEKCINLLKESYQNETIIDEVCNIIRAAEETTQEFVHIGFHWRMPRLWFLPYEITHQAFYNDLMFTQLGRSVALGEQNYLEHSILKNKMISRMKVDFSPNGILEAIEKMCARGFEASIFTCPIPLFMNLYRWTGNAHLDYSRDDPRPKLDPTLTLDKIKLAIINPIGSFPKESLLIGKNAIEWEVKRNPEGALYVVFGNHELYPLKYVELLTGISVRSIVNPEGISILSFN
jgi:hypothetical protein